MKRLLATTAVLLAAFGAGAEMAARLQKGIRAISLVSQSGLISAFANDVDAGDAPRVLVKRGELVELGIALRRAYRHWAERMDAPHPDPAERAAEAIRLPRRGAEPEFERVEP